VRERHAAPRPDLDDVAGEPVEQPAPVSGTSPLLLDRAGARLHAGERRWVGAGSFSRHEARWARVVQLAQAGVLRRWSTASGLTEFEWTVSFSHVRWKARSGG
jgi:hypothetical protein